MQGPNEVDPPDAGALTLAVNICDGDHLLLLTMVWYGTFGEFVEAFRSLCGPFEVQELYDRRSRGEPKKEQ